MADTQSRTDSFMEAATNTAIGLVISTIANHFVIPLVLGVTMTHGQNIALAVIFTVISIARSYTLRRLFNGRGVWETIRGTALSRFRNPGLLIQHWQDDRPTLLHPRFAWFPVVVEDGSNQGWRWLSWYHVRWFKGHYADYWRPYGHHGLNRK